MAATPEAASPTFRTLDRYARIICDECVDLARACGNTEPRSVLGEKFLNQAQYNLQMRDANRGWRCPDCRCYPCAWDDDYFELPLQGDRA